uniref:Hint domain-containing protein n=1 Tax=Wuchereria bancrofti TaxID=6293 RepID=A0AAF5PGG5_WUCBA
MLLPVMLFLMEAVGGQQQSAVDSSCNEYTIPFSFQSDKTGSPTLLCTSPVCFDEKRLYELKRDDVIPEIETETKNLLGSKNHIHKAQCQNYYQNISCTGEIQWTVGLLLEDDGNSIKAKWKCCNYEGLRHARAMKIVVVKADESYVGGEVYQDGRRVAFDLIKEVYLLFDEQHRPRYELKIMRLACIPKPVDNKNKLLTDKNRKLNSRAMDVSSEYDTEEYVFTNQHHTKYSKPRRLSTILEDDNFDDLFLPRHRMTHRRMFSLRRRPFYRPIAEDYDYYDYDPVILKRPSVHRRIIADGLWPINLGMVGRNRPIVAAAAVSPSLYEFTPSNAIEGDYHQFVDSDSTANPITSAQAEVYSQLSATQPVEQLLPTYSSLQYLPQRAEISSEPKTIVSAQRAVPTYSGGNVPYYNGYFETLQCFSGDTTVQTPGQIKRIDELQVGDQVLSIEESLISYSPVVMFLHRSDNESAIFNKITLENGEIIKLTDYHLLYVTNCAVGENLRLIFAKDVQLGHCLHVVKNQSNNLVPVQVSNIQRLTGKGFYAPLTANGDIIVNSILSSCHSNVAVQTLQQSIFNFLRKFRYLMPTDQNTNGLLPGIQFLTQISDLFLPYSIV